jgi:hypothetical protein
VEWIPTGDFEERYLRSNWQALALHDHFELWRWDCRSGVRMRIGLDGTPGSWETFREAPEGGDCIVAMEAAEPVRPLFPADLDEAARRALPSSARRILRTRVAREEDGWISRPRGVHSVTYAKGVPIARYYGATGVLDVAPYLVLGLGEGHAMVLDESLHDASPLSFAARMWRLFVDHVEAHAVPAVAYVELLLLEVGALALLMRRRSLSRVAALFAAALATGAIAFLAVTWVEAFPVLS